MDSEENKVRRAEINKNGLKNCKSEWWDMPASCFCFARCKYVPTILSESLAQARVAGTLRAKTEWKTWITYSGLPSPPRAVTGKNVLIHFAEKNYQISLYNVY